MQRVATFQAVKPSAARCIAVRPTRRPMVVSATAVPASVAVPVKGADGADQGSETLALKVASSDTASGLVHRYVVMVQQNARRGTASTLRRSEVRGGGKKPYAQKGTGNARRGSSTSPLFPGGGVTFGPKPTDWTIKMNKKERRLALATALQSSASDMVAIESLADQVTDKKTKSLLSVLSNVGADPASQKVLVVLSEPRDHVELAGRNVQRLKFNYASALSVYDVLNADVIVAEKAALAHIQETYGAKAAAVAAA